MVEIKSHEFDGFLQDRARHYRVFLIYGPDRGLVSERATAVARKTGVELDDPFCLVKLAAEEFQKDPGRVLDEMRSIGLFGGLKLVWLKGVTQDKPLADIFSEIATTIPESAFMIIEAGDLKKTAALRKIGEAERGVATIPCYPDDERALNALIDAELAQAGLSIAMDARQMLLDMIGGDRIASRNEVQKLALFCRGEKRIETGHVEAIMGDASAISIDDAVDAVLTGDRAGFLHAAQKIISSKLSVFALLQACLKQFQMLELLRAEMDEKRQPASAVLQTSGRHIHFRRKPAVEKALRSWSGAALARETNRLHGAILQTRQRQELEDTIALHTLLATTLQSGRGA